MTIRIGYRNPATGVITTEGPETIKVIQNDCGDGSNGENPIGELLEFRFGHTPLDTTGSDVLTDADYLASILDEATISETGTFTDGGAIQALFQNDLDSVCFVEVPEGQPAFTRFSVIGNSMMQNIPIRQQLDGVYSEMFKSGNYYFTMVQTHFDGPILLMH